MTDKPPRDSESGPASDSSFKFQVSSFRFFSPRFWGATAAVWTGAVLALALSPNATGGYLMKTLGDKVVHGCAFFVGCILYAKTLQANPRRSRITSVLIGAAISVVIGFAVEGFQIYIPARQADMMDILADVLGILPALAFLTLAEAFRKRT